MPFDFPLWCVGQPCLDQISTGDPASRQPHVVHQPEASESHQSPLSRISSSSPNHLRINHFGNHCNPQAAPSQVTLYPVRNISRCALAKSEELIEVSSCLSKYLLVGRGEGEVVHQATVGLQHRVRRLGDIFTFDLGDSSQLF